MSIPLGRGSRGDSSGRCCIGNGGLVWPETVSEGNGLCGCDGAVLCRLRLSCCCSSEKMTESRWLRGRWWRRSYGMRWPRLVAGTVGPRVRKKTRVSVFLEREQGQMKQRESEREQMQWKDIRKFARKIPCLLSPLVLFCFSVFCPPLFLRFFSPPTPPPSFFSVSPCTLLFIAEKTRVWPCKNIWGKCINIDGNQRRIRKAGRRIKNGIDGDNLGRKSLWI